jgi:phospholipase/carboxylesterase
MNPINDESAVWSVGPDQRAGRPLVVLLHGRGGREGDMTQFFGRLPSAYVAVSVCAPRPDGTGFSWLAEKESEPSLARSLDDAAISLLQWIAAARRDAPFVGLVGWSQGGAVALQALRIAPEVPAFVVTLGGFSGGSFQADDGYLARLRPPVFWGHGDVDDVIPEDDVAFLGALLRSHSMLTEVVYSGMGHQISDAAIEDVREFLNGLPTGKDQSTQR